MKIPSFPDKCRVGRAQARAGMSKAEHNHAVQMQQEHERVHVHRSHSDLTVLLASEEGTTCKWACAEKPKRSDDVFKQQAYGGSSGPALLGLCQCRSASRLWISWQENSL